MNWKEKTIDLLEAVNEINSDSRLADWNSMINNQGAIEILNSLCPENVGIQIVFKNEELLPGGVHNAGCLGFGQASGNKHLLNGTMDAASDPAFETLYEKLGWRTAVYVRVNANHQTNPHLDSDAPDLIVNNPLVLYSKEPNALSPEMIQSFFVMCQLLLSAMLLRIGTTLVNTAYERMKTVIHGAFMTITDRFIYDFNENCEEWFGPLIHGEIIEYENVFPPELNRWLKRTITARKTRNNQFVTQIMQLNRYDGKNVFAEITIKRVGVFDNIETNERMRMGTERMSLDEADNVMHYIVIQDVTERWESERLQQEMELARRMQMNLLPNSMPESDSFRIVARCRPAKQVGGDVYDLHLFNENRLAVFLGDAVGHGIDSGLLAATTMGAYRTVIRSESDPVQILKSVDETLRISHQTGFITAGCLIFSAEDHVLEYALAGQARPLIIRKGKLVENDDIPSSLPLGVNLPASYATGQTVIEPGDLIVVVSDGIMELMDIRGNLFEPNLFELLCQNHSRDIEEILDMIFKQMDLHRDAMPQEDDQTIILVRCFE